jgi:hypothetical protein
MDGLLWWFLQVGVPVTIAGLSVVKLVLPRLVDHRLNEHLENFKAQRNKELEAYKSEQQRELERLRQFLSGRVSKIHEKEFEVLPKAWFMMHEALGDAATFAVGGLFHILRPDFSKVSEEAVEDFLTTNTFLSDAQKKGLRKATDRNQYFKEAMANNYFANAYEKHRLFNNFLIENSIFMTKDLYKKFRIVADTISTAINEYQIGKDGNNWEMQKSAYDKVTGMATKLDDVEHAVQERLHYEDADLTIKVDR